MVTIFTDNKAKESIMAWVGKVDIFTHDEA